MRKNVFKLLICLLMMLGTWYQAHSQTAGTLSFTVNPTSYTTSTYTNRHFVACWIEDGSNNFVKTRYRYGSAGNCSSHLVEWKASSPTQSVVDATTAATLTTYAPLTFTWTGNDLTGSTPFNLLPDGDYTVFVEYAWDDASTAEDFVGITFTKGPTSVSLSPADETNFTGMSLTWTPANQITVTTSALASSTMYLGQPANVPFTVGSGTIYNNNTWTAQLSDATGSFSSPTNIGTLASVTAGTVSAIIPANAPTGSAYRIRVVGSQPSSVGADNGTNLSLINPLVSPTINPVSGATVDYPVNFNFNDDPAWRAAINSIRIGGVALTPTTDYVVTTGNIQLKPSGLNTLLTTAGSKDISILSTGYSTIFLTQVIDAGVPAKLGIKTQPTSPLSNGAALTIQPEVYIQDQYGNTTTSTATVTAAVGFGSWTLGGTASAIGNAGTASFTNLTATGTSGVIGASITFSSNGLTSVTSQGFNIPFPLSGSFTLGSGGSFTSLTKSDGLFANINASGLSGNVTVSVIGDILDENGAVALNQWAEFGGSGYTLTIQPSGGVTRTISGTVAGAPLINLYGADRVTIDGLNTGGNALTISNLSTSATAGTSTIQFIRDATNNTITRCTVLGSSTVTLATLGGTIVFSTGLTTGNDNNTISYCKIGPAGTNYPSSGIMSQGSTTSSAIANSNILVTNCEIYDYFAAGGCGAFYVLTGNSDWSITNNKMYQTASRAITAGMYGIYFSNSTYGNNIQITGNTIGYANSAGTGTFTLTGSGSFQGIYMVAQSTAATTCNINNNIVSNISLTSSSSTGAFTGIYNYTSASSNTINVNNNRVRNIVLATSTSTLTGIYAGSATTLYCNNNLVDSISRNAAGIFYGIRYNQPTTVTFNGDTIRNYASNVTGSTSAIYGIYTSSSVTNENLIGNYVYNFASTATGSQSFYGWYNATSGSGTRTIQNNKFYNFIAATGSASLYGIRMGSGATTEISGNQIYGFSGGTTLYGIYVNNSSGTTNNIFKNKIYNFATAASSPTCYGMYINNGTTNNISNNIIGDLRTTAASATNPLVGLYINAGTTANVYYNTIYLNATSTGTNFGSSAIYANTSPTVNLRNNIFVNASTPKGTGYASAYRRSSTTLTTYATTSNNNVFYAGTPGTYNLLMYDGTNSYQTLATFKTAVGPTRDANSFSVSPTWVSTTSSDANYLHINTTTATPIESGAVSISGYTTDFDGDTRNATTPDIGADEFSGVILDLTPPVITYTPLGNQIAGGTVVLTATITDASGVPTSGTGVPTLYYKINSGSYTSVSGVSIGSNQYTFTFAPATIAADVVSYYVVAQDNNTNKNTTAYPAAGAAGFTNDPPACTTPPTTPSTYTTAGIFSGIFNVGTSQTYTSLTGAGGLFSAINNAVVSGNITVNIISDLTETGTNGLNQWSETGVGGYTLTIRPSGGALRTISGTVAGAPLLNFNGADRVTIDGLNTAGNALTISNLSTSATAGTSTIQFTADATNNAITNCTILGSATVPLATNGGNIFIGTGTTTGNDNISISNCKIGPAGTNLPSKGICGNGSTGSAAIANNNITINNCEIYDFFLTAGSAGVYALTGNSDWSITNNKVYQTGTRTFTATGTMTGIYFANATYGDNIQITGNTVGYASNTATGTLTLTGSTIAGAFQGIYMTVMPTAAVACNINSNTVAGISLTSSTGAFTAIYNASSGTSNTININNNSIIDITLVTTTGTAQGIYAGSGNTLNCNNNTLDDITRNGAGSLYGIQYNAPNNVTFNGNTISDFFSTSTSSTSAMYGLYTGAGATNENIIGNNIFNFNSSSTGTQTIIGWYNNTGSSTGAKVVQNNNIYNLTAGGGATIYGMRLRYGLTVEASGNSVYSLSGGLTIYGMYVQSSATTNNIFKNKIYDLFSANTSATTAVYGLYVSSGTTNNIYNNIIGDLRTEASNNAISIVGIYLSGGTTDNLYYNTVNLNAVCVGNTFGSSAVYASTTPVVNMVNNIFINTSTPDGATGFTTAYRRSSTTLTSYAGTSDNNLFYAGTPGANYLIMYDGTNSYQTLDAYKLAVSPRDEYSISENANWLSTLGSDATFLHINPNLSSYINNAGTPIAGYTTDYDGDTRDANTPDIGADEFAGCFTPAPTGSASQTLPTSSTIADLVANGSTIRWYSLASGGVLYAPTDVLVDGSIYYASQTINTCESQSRFAVTVHIASETTVNLHLYLEGLFDKTNGVMVEAVDGNLGTPQYGAGIADHIQIDLFSQNAPYTAVGNSYTNVDLSTTGLATFKVPSNLNGAYYIRVSNRNHLMLWSALPISFATSPVNYNFSTDNFQGYGSNPQVQVYFNPTIYALYLGDMDQSTYIDLDDFVIFEPDLTNGTTGFLITDINGSGYVDLDDFVLFEPRLTLGNASEFPGKKK